MKALTLWEPWATLIQVGAKTIETRSWATSYRGPIAIHAAKRFTLEQRELRFTEPFRTTLAGHGLHMGCICAVAKLVACIEVCAGTELPGEPERSFGDYSLGRVMWRFEDVKPVILGPKVRGRQRLWNLPPDIAKRAKRAVLDASDGSP